MIHEYESLGLIFITRLRFLLGESIAVIFILSSTNVAANILLFILKQLVDVIMTRTRLVTYRLSLTLAALSVGTILHVISPVSELFK